MGWFRRSRLARADVARCKEHVLARIAATPLGREPFHHLYVEDVLPAAAYAGLLERMLHYKRSGDAQARRQDSAEYVNRRYSLVECVDPEVALLRETFADADVKQALLARFFVEPTRDFAGALRIHDEFEFIYTQAGRFQDIHLDIPAKFLSLVFYLPERDVTSEEEAHNATVLYDRALRPRHAARFRANSVCVFAPHFHSYHGFAATIDRDVLVMFYVEPGELARWHAARAQDVPPFDALRDCVAAKLAAHPLLEYGRDPERIASERAQCLVNAPRGRVMREPPAAAAGAGAGAPA